MGFLTGLFEQRGVSVVPSDVWRSVANVQSAAGVNVTASTALQASAVYACVRVLAEGVASLPLPVYRRLRPRGKERAPEHPLYRVLHNLANEEMTSFTLRETLMGHLGTWGNGYAEIETDGGGEVRGLWPLRPDKMELERRDGALWYKYTLPEQYGRAPKYLAAHRVLHIKGLGFDGLVGYSPVAMARQAIGLSLATEEFGARFFGNGARPGVTLQHPGHLTDDAHKRLRESWEGRHQGLENAHRVAILEEGMTLKEVGIPPEDAQFLETRKFQVVEIARLYRVPPHMIQDLERATFSNIEHQSLDYVIHTLGPWLVRWEQEIYRSLFMPSERDEYFAEFLVSGLLRGDTQSRYQAYATGRQWGWMSADDVRELENQNPLPDGQGQVYYMPLNMMPMDQLTSLDGSTERLQRIENPTNEGRREERGRRSAQGRRRLMLTHTPVYAEAAGRVVRRECNDVLNQAKKLFKSRAGAAHSSRNEAAFLSWLEGFYLDHASYVMEQFNALGLAYGELVAGAAQEEIGVEEGLTPELERFIHRYVQAFAARHNARNQDRIVEVMQAAMAAGEDVAEALEREFGLWREAQPEEIALEESVRFGNALARTVYVAGGVMALRWIAFGQSCPYCSALNGRVVGIFEVFLEAGADFQPEGAEKPLNTAVNVGHAPAHRGCDCMVAAGWMW
jgi:HK97 family phage portal protein